VRKIHKAVALVVACCIATACIFGAAYAKRRPRLTSADILTATRLAVDEAVEEAVLKGGLNDSESHLSRLITARLNTAGFIGDEVRIIRTNDFDPLAGFHFEVLAGDISVRFRLDGVRDPLLAIRLGLNWEWREDPHHPYEMHARSSVMSDCLTNHYFHLAADAPDFFARLENKTEDRYHSGVETFLVVGGVVAVDHLILGGAEPMDADHRLTYGLR
jgi:hypothetical protein